MALMNPLLGSNLVTGPPPFDTTLIGNSVWLDGSNDYLEKTFSSAPGSESGKRYVWAVWVQPPGIFSGTVFSMWCAGTSASNAYTALEFYNQQSGGGDVEFYSYNGGTSYDFRLRPTQVFRDVGWQHFLVSYDSTESSASNRIKIFHNGEEITSFAQSDYPSINHVDFPGTAVAHTLGARTGGSGGGFFKDYMTQQVFLDSKSIQNGDVAITDFLDTFTFGTNGSQFVPKKDSEIAALATTADHNSFCLDFADTSNFGNDISDNTNDFTANNMSGANQSLHTPSNVYPKVSNIGMPNNDTAANYTMTSGSNRMVYSGSNHGYFGLVSTQVIQTDDPKIYWEHYLESGSVGGSGGGRVGVGLAATDFDVANTGSAFVGAGGNNPSNVRGVIYDNGSQQPPSGGAADTSATKVPVGGIGNYAYEPSTGKFWVGLNGTWNNGSATASTTLNPSSHDYQTTPQDFVFFLSAARSTDISVLNFGDNPTFSGNETAGGNSDANGHGNFKYAVPSGFLAPNSANLTAPDFQGIDHFNAVKYAGNGTAIGSGGKAVTGVGFQPDWVWIKNRDASDSHALYDVVRGTTKQIETDTTAIETTEAEGLSVFGSDGFTLGSLAEVNTSSEDYISWNWLAGGSASSNSNGSITSSVSAATPGHFSIVSWTGTASHGATVGHGLNGEPEFVIAIARNESGQNKPVYHKFMTSDFDHLKINDANTQGTASSATLWDISAMSSTVIGLGAQAQSNSSNGMIAYCFRSIPGVCKVGKYKGNNSSDGTYVSLGFTPAWFMARNLSGSSWFIIDNKRGFNSASNEAYLQAESDTTETVGNVADLLSDGIKWKTSGGGNATNTILYVAIADLGGNGTLPPIYGR